MKMASMCNVSDCACSGIRSCLVCENKKEDVNFRKVEGKTGENNISLSFCINCQRVFSGTSCDHDSASKKSSENGVLPVLTGVTVIENFVSSDEELFIMSEIEKFPWRTSQSGRMKQDFGPKVNFKKKRVKLGRFSGLPSFSQFFIERLQKEVPQLANFNPVELCNLDYCPERGAAIDPHMDDSWLWGEHLVTLNLLSDTTLTLTDSTHLHEVKVPLPRYSLVILKGMSRYKWMHGIKRNHIQSRRIAVTLRELSEEFVSGNGYEDTGCTLLKLATSYTGLPTSS